MRSVRIPSTSSASASPIMAKSVKSRWACSRKRCRSGPSIGGIPRVRTASARARKRATISCGSNPGMAVSVEVALVQQRHRVEPADGSTHGRAPVAGATGRHALPRRRGPATARPDLGQGRHAARNHYNDPAVDLARTVRP